MRPVAGWGEMERLFFTEYMADVPNEPHAQHNPVVYGYSLVEQVEGLLQFVGGLWGSEQIMGHAPHNLRTFSDTEINILFLRTDGCQSVLPGVGSVVICHLLRL